jgi:ribosomal protein S18 acetylase RimI-like enzyme
MLGTDEAASASWIYNGAEYRATEAMIPRASPAVQTPLSRIRHATLRDTDALVRMENRCFVTDRITRRSFRYLLSRANATTLVEEAQGVLRGYAMVLFNAGTSLARLYSFAVEPEFRGRGIGVRLLQAVDEESAARDCVAIRLEVRRDNAPAMALFQKAGYRQFGSYADYYEDHMDALRLEKSLAPHLSRDLAKVPYYCQTTDFTCGSATLMMAMKALDPSIVMDRKLELRIWREATTVFMTSGHGGCGPYGLALAAYHRGFEVEIYVNEIGSLFVDSVRSREKKDVIRLVHEDFLEEIARYRIHLTHGALKVAQLQEKFEEGGIPIVLISSYRIYDEKFPHWVVVTDFDERFIYVHDPYIDQEAAKILMDCINMPILKKDFERMARYGKAGQKAVVILRRRGKRKVRDKERQIDVH